MTRARLRDLGITIGRLPTGANNAITDVPGVWVGHRTLIYDEPAVARTGVTAVTFRENRVRDDFAYAGYFSFNGCGEMTGVPWLEESGLLTTPILLTNTNQVGLVRDAVITYGSERFAGGAYWLPVVAETYDGWLNDIAAGHINRGDVFAALDAAAPGPVAEGNVGGGTGMICHDFKGGIGTASRVVEAGGEPYTVGVLVQANYGNREDLRVDGVPVGRMIGPDQVPLPWTEPPAMSSIIVIIATDAPLIPVQCRRLAKRATVGLARTGGLGYAFSGDLFLAFSTGNHLPFAINAPYYEVRSLTLPQVDPLVDGVAEAVEESIVNALVAAETMTGRGGHIAHALPHDLLVQAMAKRRGPAAP